MTFRGLCQFLVAILELCKLNLKRKKNNKTKVYKCKFFTKITWIKHVKTERMMKGLGHYYILGCFN